MIRICPKCGALLMDDAEGCSFCEVPSEQSETLEPVLAGAVRSEADAEPEWRREVSRRLEQYRARRHGVAVNESQPTLPFRETPKRTERIEIPIPERPARPRTLARIRPAERMEISIQPEFDFSAAASQRSRPQTALVPVASLSLRRDAGMLDAFFILLTCGAFVGLFRSLGGQVALDRIDGIVCFAVAYLFYSLYFLVFTIFAGSTPGMQLRGLSVVRLDGSLPDTGQLLWRGFGCLLSAATFMLGYLWSLWDEDGFTWQDRMSQTYITAATPLADADPLEVHPTPRMARRPTAS